MEQNLFHISYSFLIHLFLTISPKYSSFRFKIFKNYLKKSFHSIIYNSTISQILIRLLINKLLLFLPFPLPPILTSILSKFSLEIYSTTQPGRVHISSDAKALLSLDRYHVESRGLVWVKVRIHKKFLI